MEDRVPDRRAGAASSRAASSAPAGLRALVGLAVVLAVAGAARAERPARFEVLALGVLGGDDDGNLSAYLVGRVGEAPRLLVDGGSLVPGLARAAERDGHPATTPAARAALLRHMLGGLTAALTTHAHDDHVAGLLLALPTLVATPRAAPLDWLALPATLEALRAHAWNPTVWLDPLTLPRERPMARALPLAPGTTRGEGPYTVEAIALSHAVPSAAFLIRDGEAAYLHLGDTGPTDVVWMRARPLLAAATLRGVAVEVSFPTAREALARATGHLTPRLLLGELVKLTGLGDVVVPRTAAEEDALAARLGHALGACRVVAIHIKAAEYDEVARDLERLRAAGLPLVLPEQGQRYRF